MELSPGTSSEPSGGVEGDGPLSCFATKPNENCADKREAKEECGGSELTGERMQIDRETYRKDESEEEKCEFSSK